MNSPFWENIGRKMDTRYEKLLIMLNCSIIYKYEMETIFIIHFSNSLLKMYLISDRKEGITEKKPSFSP